MLEEDAHCFPPTDLLSPGVLREVTTHFTVDARAHIKSGGSHVKVSISNQSGSSTDAYLTDRGDGCYRAEYTPYEDGEDGFSLLLEVFQQHL